MLKQLKKLKLRFSLVGLTHVDRVVSKDSPEASSAVVQVEVLPLGSVRGRLLRVELPVCVCEGHSLALSHTLVAHHLS